MGKRHSALSTTRPLPPVGSPLASSGPDALLAIAPHGVGAAGVEAVLDGQVLAAAVGRGEAEPGGQRHHGGREPGEGPRGLQARLEEVDVAPEGIRGRLERGEVEAAAVGIERGVAPVPGQGAGHAGHPVAPGHDGRVGQLGIDVEAANVVEAVPDAAPEPAHLLLPEVAGQGEVEALPLEVVAEGLAVFPEEARLAVPLGPEGPGLAVDEVGAGPEGAGLAADVDLLAQAQARGRCRRDSRSRSPRSRGRPRRWRSRSRSRGARACARARSPRRRRRAWPEAAAARRRPARRRPRSLSWLPPLSRRSGSSRSPGPNGRRSRIALSRVSRAPRTRTRPIRVWGPSTIR